MTHYEPPDITPEEYERHRCEAFTRYEPEIIRPGRRPPVLKPKRMPKLKPPKRPRGKPGKPVVRGDGKVYPSVVAAAKAMKISSTNIFHVVRGRRKQYTAGGHRWRYAKPHEVASVVQLPFD